MSTVYIGVQDLFSRKNVEAAIKEGMKQAVKAGRKEFERHAKEYTGGFRIEEQIGVEESAVGTNDERVFFVDQGTRPHVITGNLAFASDYRAKTVVHQIPSRPGGAFGAAIYAESVQHPGVEKREVAQAIADKVAGQLSKIFDGVLARSF